VAYVGNKGTHTLSNGDGNNTNPNEAAIVLPGTSTAFGQPISSVNGQTLHYDPSVNSDPSKGPIIAADGGTSTQALLTRYLAGSLAACKDPLYTPQTFAGVTLPAGACGWTQGIQFNGDDQNTNYNAMQVTLTQQQWKGLNFTTNYAWQSSFNHNSGYSTWDKSAGYGRDDNVRANVFNTYGSYELPFGKGKKFVPDANRMTDLLIGGFMLSGTLNVSSGLPFTLSTSCPLIPGSAPCYPNVVPNGRLPTHLTSFNPATQKRLFYTVASIPNGLFSSPALDQIGNVGRNTYYGPSFYNTDLALQKSFHIWESVQAQFRFDAYNAVNHINPGNPGGNITADGTIGGEAPGPGPRQLVFSLRVQF
jgi:hypothetical protein